MSAPATRRSRPRLGSSVAALVAATALIAFSVVPVLDSLAEDDALAAGAQVASTGLSRRNPAAVVEKVVTSDYAVTLLDAEPGDLATDRIAAAGAGNGPPVAGKE